MLLRTFVGCFCLALALAVPGALAAAEGELNVAFSSVDKAEIRLDATLSGGEAAALRRQIDESGPSGDPQTKDGQVSTAEVQRFQQSLLTLLNQRGNSGAPGADFTLDGHPPSRINATAFDVHGAEGSVNSTDPTNIHLAVALEFAPGSGNEHVLHVKGQGSSSSSQTPLTSSTVALPPGYRVKGSDGLPAGATVSDDKSTITFPGSSWGTHDIDITFTKGGGGRSPAPAFAWILLGALLGAAAVRTRRGPQS